MIDRPVHNANAHTQTQTQNAHMHTQQRLPNIFVSTGCHSNRAAFVLRNPMAAVRWPSGRETEWETQTEREVRDNRKWEVE